MIMHWLFGKELTWSATEVLLDSNANLFKMLKKWAICEYSCLARLKYLLQAKSFWH